jgi:proton-dependent oligopeptide transporter, POT family
MQLKQLKKNIAVLCLARCLYTIGFSVMFVSLALYFNSVLHINEKVGSQVTSVFLALNFGLPLIGGWLGNNYINFKKLFSYGLLTQSVGYFTIALSHDLFFIDMALSFVLMGGMVLSICVVEFISNSIEEHKEYHRIAMLLNYGSMNVGFIVGSVLAGVFALHHLYHVLFIILAVFPILSAGIVRKYVVYTSTPITSIKHQTSLLLLVLAFLSTIIQLVFHYTGSSHTILLTLAGLGMVISLSYGFIKSGKGHKKTNLVFLFYLLIFIVFWAVFMLTPITLMYFIRDAVDLNWHQIHIQPQWLDIDPIILIIGTPLLAYATSRLKSKLKLSLPTYFYFTLGMLLVSAASYYISVELRGISGHEKLPIIVILIYISLLALGELFIAPEGYTLPGRMAAKHVRGLFTGIWVASISMGSLFSAAIANHYLSASRVFNIQQYYALFHNTFIFSLMAAAIVFFAGFFLRKYAIEK